MIKKNVFILWTLFSCLGLQAQTIQKEEIKVEALPEGNVVRVHVSGRTGQSAALLQRSDGYWVYINQSLYGPFDQADVLNSSPFETASDNWQFRAVRQGRGVLVVNGVQCGPFDDIWTPNFSKTGKHWGALVKNGSLHALVVDGVTTNFFSVIFHEGVGQDHPLWFDTHASSTAPYFYGTGDRWVAVAYRNASPPSNQAGEFRFLTGAGEGPSFDQVEDPTVMETDPDGPLGLYGYIQYQSFLTLDRESLALSVHRPGSPTGANHLWINQQTYGPYPGGVMNYAEGFRVFDSVAGDGSNWVIYNNEDTIYTKDKTLRYRFPFLPAISKNGRSFSFNYIGDQVEYTYVNGIEYGPYKFASSTLFSPRGEHWISLSTASDGAHYLNTERAVVYGPYFGAPSVVYRDENTWISYAKEGDNNYYVSVNGIKTAGPFQTVFGMVDSPPSSSCLVGFQGDQATLLINGQVRFQQTGFRAVEPIVFGASPDLASWVMALVNLDGTISFIDNGRIQSGLPRPRNRFLLSSKNKDRNALLLVNGNNNVLAINGERFGPFSNFEKLVLSSSSSSWVAVGKAEIEGPKRLIFAGSPPVEYDDVFEMKAVDGKEAVIYNGVRDNRSFPKINNISLGTYNQASINCADEGSSTVYLATDDGSRQLRTYKITLQP